MSTNSTLMGATPYSGGVTFRVWAPFATSVYIATSNGWESKATLLDREGGGVWAKDIPGVSIGDSYKFLINFNPANPNTNFLWKNDPYARELKSDAGGNLNSVVAANPTPFNVANYRTPPWNELVMYELHVGTFDPSATTGHGTFDTLDDKLDYLAALGINAIEVMPSTEFQTTQSMGYNPAYIYAIETDYGGPNGFRTFVEKAHQRGIAVVMDVVYNHFGPEGLDIWQFDGWFENTGDGCDNHYNYGGIYFYNNWKRCTLWGENRPDYGRGEVRTYILDNALRWLEQRYVDGLRWDATAFIRNVYGNNNDPAHDLDYGYELLRWVNREMKKSQPWKISIAEDVRGNRDITRPESQGGFNFDSQWDSDFLYPIRRSLTAIWDSDRKMNEVAGAIGNYYDNNAFKRVIYTENHDIDKTDGRLPEVIAPGEADGYYACKRSTLGAAIMLTSPGIPMLFQGQEFLEWGKWNDQVNLDWKKGDREPFSKILQLYTDLIRYRRNWYDNTRGLRGNNLNIFEVNDTNKVIAYHRWEQGGPRDDVVIVLNFGSGAYGSSAGNSYRVGFPRGGLWKLRFNSDWNGYSSDFGSQPSFDTNADPMPYQNMPFSGEIMIGPYTALIFSQDY